MIRVDGCKVCSIDGSELYDALKGFMAPIYLGIVDMGGPGSANAYSQAVRYIGY